MQSGSPEYLRKADDMLMKYNSLKGQHLTVCSERSEGPAVHVYTLSILSVLQESFEGAEALYKWSVCSKAEKTVCDLNLLSDLVFFSACRGLPALSQCCTLGHPASLAVFQFSFSRRTRGHASPAGSGTFC